VVFSGSPEGAPTTILSILKVAQWELVIVVMLLIQGCYIPVAFTMQEELGNFIICLQNLPQADRNGD